ncbi:MAG: hypothetical protein IPN69_09725 [Acidobacteria bacterium]|nr:hypothetical protein [Acidobacteriota bacterium]
MSILHKDHKSEESEIRFKFLSDSVLKAFEKDIAILDFGFWILDFGLAVIKTFAGSDMCSITYRDVTRERVTPTG